jgi:hypothetical protein
MDSKGISGVEYRDLRVVKHEEDDYDHHDWLTEVMPIAIKMAESWSETTVW